MYSDTLSKSEKYAQHPDDNKQKRKLYEKSSTTLTNSSIWNRIGYLW